MQPRIVCIHFAIQKARGYPRPYPDHVRQIVNPKQGE